MIQHFRREPAGGGDEQRCRYLVVTGEHFSLQLLTQLIGRLEAAFEIIILSVNRGALINTVYDDKTFNETIKQSFNLLVVLCHFEPVNGSVRYLQQA